jgi:hypothetical protein
MTSPRASAAQRADVSALSAATLASERTIPVDEVFAALFGHAGPGVEAGLVRGQVIACTGQAAATIALGLATEAVRKGAWLVVVDVPWLGIEAAAELGVPLERLVGVDTGVSGSPTAWVEAMGAAADGFDLIITSVPWVSAASARRVQQRVKARGAVLLTLSGNAASSHLLVPDLEIDAVDVEWTGLGAGHGHLAGRRVRAIAIGRRWPRPRSAALWLPGPSGRIERANDTADVIPWRSSPGDPSAEDQPA